MQRRIYSTYECYDPNTYPATGDVVVVAIFAFGVTQALCNCNLRTFFSKNRIRLFSDIVDGSQFIPTTMKMMNTAMYFILNSHYYIAILNTMSDWSYWQLFISEKDR